MSEPTNPAPSTEPTPPAAPPASTTPPAPVPARPLPQSGYEEWDEAGLSRLPNAAEVAGILFSRFLNRAFPIFILAVALLGLVIAVPSSSVARSEPYRVAREFVATNPEVLAELGPVTACETVPTRYTIDKDAARFTFQVFGEGTAGVATLWLRHADVWQVTSGSFVQAFDRIAVGRVHHLAGSGVAPVDSR